jgi:hypothetical protein
MRKKNQCGLKWQSIWSCLCCHRTHVSLKTYWTYSSFISVHISRGLHWVRLQRYVHTWMNLKHLICWHRGPTMSVSKMTVISRSSLQ